MSVSIQEAISTATSSRLRKVLTEITSKNAEARRLAESMLLIDISAQELSSKKRKAREELDIDRQTVKQKRYLTCVQCKVEYDVLANKKDSCTFHPGRLIVDDESSAWDDWDECHGPREDMLDDAPDGFVWTCCKGSEDVTSCLTLPHSAIRLNYSVISKDLTGDNAGSEDAGSEDGGHSD